jgi:hypothetical protein
MWEKGEKSAPKFVPSSNYHKEEKALKPNKTHYPSNLKPLCACFVAVPVTWMSFALGVRELRWGALTMLETHIVISSLIFCLILTLVLRVLWWDFREVHYWWRGSDRSSTRWRDRDVLRRCCIPPSTHRPASSTTSSVTMASNLMPKSCKDLSLGE